MSNKQSLLKLITYGCLASFVLIFSYFFPPHILQAGAASSSPSSDFQARCSDPNVIRCYGFDDPNDLDNSHPIVLSGSSRILDGPEDLCSGNDCSTLDTSIKVTGNSSLRFEIPSNSPADTSGSFRINFQDDFTQQIGEGETVYVQYRYRVSNRMMTPFEGGLGYKQIIVGEGDRIGNREVWSCTSLENVINTTNRFMAPIYYHNCGRYTPLSFHDGTQVRVQHQGPPYCYYPDDPQGGCWSYKPNNWMTMQLMISVGTWNTASSRIKVWAAYDGEPSVMLFDSNISAPDGWTEYNSDPDAKLGKVWLLPYNTGKSASESHPTGYVWYDDLIISRARIPDPGSSPSGSDTIPPAAPVSLQVQ